MIEQQYRDCADPRGHAAHNARGRRHGHTPALMSSVGDQAWAKQKTGQPLHSVGVGAGVRSSWILVLIFASKVQIHQVEG